MEACSDPMGTQSTKPGTAVGVGQEGGVSPSGWESGGARHREAGVLPLCLCSKAKPQGVSTPPAHFP